MNRKTLIRIALVGALLAVLLVGFNLAMGTAGTLRKPNMSIP